MYYNELRIIGLYENISARPFQSCAFSVIKWMVESDVTESFLPGGCLCLCCAALFPPVCLELGPGFPACDIQHNETLGVLVLLIQGEWERQSE